MNIHKSTLFLLSISLAIILSDSLINYFLRVFFRPLPINAMVVPIFFALIVMGRFRPLVPGIKTLLWILASVFGYVIGIINAPDITPHRFFQIGTALIAFFVGFGFFKNCDDENIISFFFTTIALFYVVVCTIALSRTLPSLFPVQDQIWAYKGLLLRRPEVTTDQNFQILYLFPAALVLALPTRLIRLIVTLITVIGALFVTAQLQTRSGTLVLLGTIVLSLSAPLFIPSLGRKKTLILPVAGIVAIILAMPFIISSSELLFHRLAATDFETGFGGRLKGFFYLFKHVWNPLWWIPQGNTEFLTATGARPHSNITATFLEGGILSLAAWFGLVVYPTARLGFRFLSGRLSHASTMIFIGCLTMLVLQLSLNVPMNDQVWLWTGAGVGVLSREKLGRAPTVSKESSAYSTPHPNF
jgi:hypothetical protein